MEVELITINPDKGAMNIDYDRIGSENKPKITNNHTTKRVCHFCHREFTSGKGLGGHMRIHVQKKADVDDKKLPITFKKKKIKNHHHRRTDYYEGPVCAMCGKVFPSWKSLYGHMRCHPGRGWKGTIPPSLLSSSSTFSSSLSDAIVPTPPKPDDVAVDLAASLKSWPVTAERGRKAGPAAAAAASSEVSSSSVVDVELLDAIDHLLMLSRGIEPSDQELESSDKEKKKKKKSDLGLEKEEVNKYKCDICDRSFSSPQAFGGHRASHNKIKIVIINSSDDQVLASSRRGIEFDLNEMPPLI